MVVPPMPPGSAKSRTNSLWTCLTVSRSQGGWVMPDVAGCAVWPGITRLGVAGCGWATVTVGSQLGSQLGYLATSEPAGMQPPGGSGWATAKGRGA